MLAGRVVEELANRRSGDRADVFDRRDLIFIGGDERIDIAKVLGEAFGAALTDVADGQADRRAACIGISARRTLARQPNTQINLITAASPCCGRCLSRILNLLA